VATRKPTEDQRILDATLKMKVCAEVLQELGKENVDRGGVTKLREGLHTIASVMVASTKQVTPRYYVERSI
jgi:hypothetical protein